MRYEDEIKRAWSKLSGKEITQLLVDMINIPTPTGSEEACARRLIGFMESHGLEVRLQEVEDNRANGIGIVRGSGGGNSLLFNGHLDTSFTGDDDDLPLVGKIAPGLTPKAVLKNGWIWGLGARNMKAGVTAMAAAACAINDARVKLKGDLIIAGVVGEIEKSPIDGLFRKFRGSKYRGAGIGIRYLLEHGITADYSIITEPTDNRVTRARPGYMHVKLTTEGTVAYVPFKTEKPSDSAILKMTKVIQALESDFRLQYARRHTYDLGEDGQIIPQINVGAIESGWPFKPGYIPAVCYAYLDMRTAPYQTAKEALKELKQFLDKLADKTGIRVTIDPYLLKVQGSETPADSYVVKAAKTAFEFVSGKKHFPQPSTGQSVSDDSNVTRQNGIPSITWGPRSALPEYGYTAKDQLGEAVMLKDVMEAAKMFVAASIDICSKPK